MLLPASFLQPMLHTMTPVMVGVLHRAVNLRAALKHLSRTVTVCAAADRYSPVSPYRRFLPSTSWHFRVQRWKLHTGAGDSKPSSNGAPDRLSFSRVTEEDVAFFRKTLPGRAITDPDLLESSNVDWLKSVRGDNS